MTDSDTAYYHLAVRFPDGEETSVHVSESEHAQTLKDKILALKVAHIHPKRMMILFDETILDSDSKSTLKELGLFDGAIIIIVVDFSDLSAPLEDECSYDAFLHSTSPLIDEQYINLRPNIRIQFKENTSGLVIYTPTFTSPLPLSDIEGLPNCEYFSTPKRREAERVREHESFIALPEAIGEKKADSLGYRCWKRSDPMESHLYRHRIYLLELPGADVASHHEIENRRYSYWARNCYSVDKDHSSWQRYTDVEPIPCQVKTTFFVPKASELDPDIRSETTVEMKPNDGITLKPNTKYAVLLQHGVSVVSRDFLESSLCRFSGPGFICDDKLIPFSTCS